MSTLQIKTPRVFAPLLQAARYKGAYGGRGSGKSHFFAESLIEHHVMTAGARSACLREHQKSLKESAKRLLEDKIQALNVGSYFDVQDKVIKSHKGGIMVFEGLKDHTADSIKSMEGYSRFWCEEAHTLSEHSLRVLRPTARVQDSEMWFSWNPRFKRDPIDQFLRTQKPDGAIVVRANWSDNPWWKETALVNERLLDVGKDDYNHVWEGDYAVVFKGAYYADSLMQARKDRRIGGRIAADPLMSLRAYWDIGGTGQKSDATAIWIVQFVGREIRVLNYYEAQGQPMAAHVQWLRDSGYQKALCVLPHDGGQHEKVHQITYESALRDCGFDVRVVPNMGSGAAMARVSATRRLFPQMWFDDNEQVRAGLETLGAYHEKRDEERNIGLGPNHDWSSHGADAFGLMAVDYAPPQQLNNFTPRRIKGIR